MKPECEKIQEEILNLPLGDGSLQQASIQNHLDHCPDCAQFAKDVQVLSRGLNELETFYSPSELSDHRILQAAKNRKDISTGGFWGFFLRKSTLAAAMLFLIAGAGIFSKQWLEKHPQKSSFDGAVTPATAPAPAQSNASQGSQNEIQKPAVMKSLSPQKTEPQSDTGVDRLKYKSHEQTIERDLVPPPEPAAPIATDGKSDMTPTRGGWEIQSEPKEKTSSGFLSDTENTELGRKKAAAPLPQSNMKSSDEAPPTKLEGRQTKSLPEQEENFRGEFENQAPSQASYLQRAKALIQEKKYGEALAELEAAEKLGSTKEIKRLIKLCQEKTEPHN